MNARQEDEAVFWCGLLTSVLFENLEKGEERRRLRELSQQEVVFPGGRKRKPSLSTLKRKLKQYRDGGFNALGRKARDDRGRPRAVGAEVLATAIAAKQEQPRRSALMLNLILEQEHGRRVARSTLYRPHDGYMMPSSVINVNAVRRACPGGRKVSGAGENAA